MKKTTERTLPDATTHSGWHYGLAGAHAVAAESRNGMSPADVPPHVAEARGRLIAADLDLLQACKAALERLRASQPPHGGATDLVCKQCGAAIAKAKASYDAAQERLALINAMSDSEICQIAVEFAAERQHAAIEQARYWLRVGAPGRALEVLESVL